MSLVEMQKVNLIALSQYKDQILQLLQESELIHILKISNTPNSRTSSSDFDYKLAELKSTIAFLEHIGQHKKSFIESFVPPKDEITQADIKKTIANFNYQEIINQYKHLENRLNNLKNLINELQIEYAKVTPWASLDIPLENLSHTQKTSILTGTVKKKNLETFKNQVSSFSKNTEINIINELRGQVFLVLVYLNEDKKDFDQLLSKTNLNPVDLPSSKRTASEELAHIIKVKKEAQAEVNKQLAEAKQLLPNLSKLKLTHDYFLEQKNQLLAKENFFMSQHTFVVEGWIKKKDFNKLKVKLKSLTQAFELYRVKPDEKEKPPVVIENPKLASPFELITKVYGNPKNDELDPTLPLSFFFALFFGMCLGDFGYGLSLILISIYFLKKYKLPQGGQSLFELFILGGGVSMLVGILTGTYFGLSPEGIPNTLLPLRNLLLSLQIVNPIKNPLTMLIISLALGVIQIFFGISLQIYNNIRNKRYLEALFDDVFWMFFLGSLVFLIVSSAMSLATTAIASKMSILGAILLIFTQGRHKTNIIQKFLSGLLSLYKVTSYMGDTLSYSRLLALGMSSAIIGSVINILAGMVKSVPIFGIVLMAVLLIFGHIFNLIISTLGAFVHSMRLQMVEFFSKFYEGGGMEFKPFKREAEYTIIRR